MNLIHRPLLVKVYIININIFLSKIAIKELSKDLILALLLKKDRYLNILRYLSIKNRVKFINLIF